MSAVGVKYISPFDLTTEMEENQDVEDAGITGVLIRGKIARTKD